MGWKSRSLVKEQDCKSVIQVIRGSNFSYTSPNDEYTKRNDGLYRKRNRVWRRSRFFALPLCIGSKSVEQKIGNDQAWNFLEHWEVRVGHKDLIQVMLHQPSLSHVYVLFFVACTIMYWHGKKLWRSVAEVELLDSLSRVQDPYIKISQNKLKYQSILVNPKLCCCK